MTASRNGYNLIFRLLIISVVLDAYSFVNIGNFSVTPFLVVSIICIPYLIFKNRKLVIRKYNKSIGWILIFAAYSLFNYLFYGFENTASFLQSIFYIVLFLLMGRNEDDEQFNGAIAFFQKCINVLSVYGIYQFIGRIVGLPLCNLTIEGHMVEGFNWTNATYFAGSHIYRSNAICREPSFFSQLLAINILMYFTTLIRGNKRNTKTILFMLINIVAMLSSMSGTCFIVLFGGLIIFIIVELKRNNSTYLKRILKFCSYGIVGLVAVFLFTDIGAYLLTRITELVVYSENSAAGFVRFRSWIDVLKDAWNLNPFFGTGVGTAKEYVATYSVIYHGMSINGLARVATEFGICGLVIWLGFICSFLNSKVNTRKNKYYMMLSCCILPLAIAHETFSSNVYWLFLILLNCKLIENKNF